MKAWVRVEIHNSTDETLGEEILMRFQKAMDYDWEVWEPRSFQVSFTDIDIERRDGGQ